MVLTAGPLIMHPFSDVFFNAESFSRAFRTVLTVSFPQGCVGSCRQKQVPKLAEGDGRTSLSLSEAGDCQSMGDRARCKAAQLLRKGTACLQKKL